MMDITIDSCDQKPVATGPQKRMSILPLYFWFIIIGLLVTGTTLGQDFRMEGTWRVNVQETLLASQNADKARYDSLSELKVKNFQRSLEGREYVFKADGTIQISITQNGETKKSTGKWNYRDNKGTLTVALAKSEHVFLVQKRDQNEIMLIRADRQTRSLLVDIVLSR
jgi:hypothetical protein